MRAGARGFCISLLAAAFVVGAGAMTAGAQEISVDSKALDPSGVATPAKAKKTHAKRGGATTAGEAKPTKTPDRQFGELEGWSPGKTPPKPKDKADDVTVTPGKTVPVSVSPSGGLGVGLPF